MQYMTPVLIVLAMLPTAYYYFMFRRMCGTLGLEVKRPVCIVIRVILTLVIWHFTCHITSTAAVFLYLVLVADLLVRLADLIFRKITKKTNARAGRRVWDYLVGLSIIPIVLVTGTFIYGNINIRNVVETHYTVTTDKNIPEEGFRVCFLSDVHCGIALNAEDYERISREIESKNVDIVILGGDLLDFNSKQEEAEAMFASFGSIRTTAGIFYIFGNHDRTGDYKESLFTEEYIIGLCESNGITVLQDEQVDFENGILLIGREDKTTRYGRIRKTADELFEEVDAEDDRFILVADHQPSEYAELASGGTDAVLDGHLHAGQIFPFNLLILLTNREHVVYGRYRITQNGNEKMDADGPAKEGEGTSSAIVSSGLAGWSYAIRTSGPAEYCIIDLKKDK